MEEDNTFFQSMQSFAPQQVQENRQRVVECESCGASNTIAAGQEPVCKYCGNGLEG